MTKRLIVFCGAYTQIEFVLYLVTHNWRDRAVTIVVVGRLPDLYKFFRVINEKCFDNKINIVHFESYRPRRAGTRSKLKRVFYLLPDIIGERRYLGKSFGKYFSSLKGVEIYFSGKGFGTNAYYILRRLCRANRLVYVYSPDETYTIEEFIPTNLKDFADFIINKLIYGPGIAVGRIPYTHFPCIPDKFLRKGVAEIIDHEARTKMMNGFNLSQFKEVLAPDNNYRVIYFHQDLVQAGFVSDVDTLRAEMAEIFNVLRKYLPENEVAAKFHPNYPGDKTLVTYGKIIDDYIPGEFLYSSSVKMYLSTFSVALANVEKGLAVSVADLITLRDDATRKQLKELLVKRSRRQITFPKTLGDFEEIVAKLSKEVRIS